MFRSLSLLLLMVLLGSSSFAVLELELTRGTSATMPIVVRDFSEASSIADVVRHDLSLSGRFRTAADGGNDDLHRQGVQYILSGEREASGAVHFRLIDLLSGERVALEGRVFPEHPRRAAHQISDRVYEKITGQRGVFSTKIAYVLSERYGYNRGRYELQVSDYDGEQPKTILRSPQPLMSPSWSPDGRRLAYVSFEGHRARIFSQDVLSGQRQLISSFDGINGAPAWSRDGRSLAVVLSRSGHPKIYTFDLASRVLKQVTYGDSIDTEPSWAPDGRSLLFTSDRGGAPQVYRVSLETGGVSRVTFSGSYNAKASYSPDGRSIALLHRGPRGYQVAVMDVAYGQVRMLTEGGHEESPSWAPNGALLMYATGTSKRGTLGIVSVDGRTQWRLPESLVGVQEPAWSPFARDAFRS